MRVWCCNMQRSSLTRWWSGEGERVDVSRSYLCWSGVRPDANDGVRLKEPPQYAKEEGVRWLARCSEQQHEYGRRTVPFHCKTYRETCSKK